ncbi:MAG: hypothetical protein LBK41_01745 [Clostridiales bacterium]|nr:hypothetical protein [Clostridiales bacterium]
MKNIVGMLPFLIIVGAAFYGLPPVAWMFEDPMLKQATEIERYIVLALPVVCFIVSVIYGGMRGFHALFPLLVGVISLPAVLLYYNYTAWIYVVIYTVDAAVSSGFGAWYRALSLDEKQQKAAEAQAAKAEPEAAEGDPPA